MNNNQIEAVNDLECVKELKELKTLYVEFNPLTKDTQHRKKLVDFCPTLEQVFRFFFLFFVFIFNFLIFFF